LTDERIPVWIADYVLMGYGTGAIMAVPAHDERDFAFARQFNLPIRVVIQPEGEDLDPETMVDAYHGPGTLVNSGPLNGKVVPEDLPKIIAWLEDQGRGKAEVNFRLRDWLISRQRYWGTPIPIVYCDDCGVVPVPESDLPVLLPLDAEFTPTGQSPLVTHQDFLNVSCPTCGKPARRETDTMDTFVDSSWYWFRYTSPDESSLPFDPESVSKWCPVDLYCGGIEHAILHLLYARFVTKACRDIGLVDHGEPYLRLRNQGMILAKEGTKMSKSRGTQVGPDDLVATHGADALRLHLMYLGPWDQGGPWNDSGINGMERYIRRAFQVVADTPHHPTDMTDFAEELAALVRLTHQTIRRATTDMNEFQFNTMIAALNEFVNELMRLKDTPVSQSREWRDAVESLVLMMAPSTPYAAEELWERLGKPYSVHTQRWPPFEEELAKEDFVEIVVQINGKVRERLYVRTDLSEEEAVQLALSQVRVQEGLAGKSPSRVIYVPGRLLNLVVR
jgi:leucyl-tRNA synthetase